jgi:hypothetical protein
MYLENRFRGHHVRRQRFVRPPQWDHNKRATMGDGTAPAALAVAIAALVLVLAGGLVFWLSAQHLVNEQDIPWRVQAITVHLQNIDTAQAKLTTSIEQIAAFQRSQSSTP